MNTTIKIFAIFISLVTVLTGCTKDHSGTLDDIRPAVPVTVTNAIDYRPDPTVSTSISGGGAIQIILSIPTQSGRSIKEITKIAASTAYTQIQSTGTTGFYNTAPLPVGGTSVTFTTSLTAYFVNKPVSSSNPAAAVNMELGNRFYFLLTLDDGSQIVTEPVRVLVLN